MDKEHGDAGTRQIPYFENLDDLIDNGLDLGEALGKAPEFDIACCNWAQEFPCRPHATVRMAHGNRFLCCLFRTDSRRMAATTAADLGPVSSDSCVEIFLRPEGSDEYWNFEFNCIGCLNASHRRTRTEAVRLNEAERRGVRRYPSAGTEPFEERDADGAWSLAVAIPLELMHVGGGRVRLDGNIYACASSLSEPYYLSHAPIATPRPDFHRPEFFVPFVLL